MTLIVLNGPLNSNPTIQPNTKVYYGILCLQVQLIANKELIGTFNKK